MAIDKIPAHIGEITKIRVSPDGRYVFTVGEVLFTVFNIIFEGWSNFYFLSNTNQQGW